MLSSKALTPERADPETHDETRVEQNRVIGSSIATFQETSSSLRHKRRLRHAGY